MQPLRQSYDIRHENRTYTVAIAADTGALRGWNFMPVFFRDIIALTWPGQFNLDFSCLLSLSGLWLAWRWPAREGSRQHPITSPCEPASPRIEPAAAPARGADSKAEVLRRAERPLSWCSRRVEVRGRTS